MKKLISMIMVFVMILSFGACHTKEKNVQKSLYEQGLDIISLMVELIRFDDYTEQYSKHQIEKIQELANGDFSIPKKVYEVTITKETLLALAELEFEHSSEQLKGAIANRILEEFITSINGRLGVSNFNISKRYKIEKAFVNTDMTENVIYIYTYENATPIAVTFTMQEDGAVTAVGNFIMNKDFSSDSVEEIQEFFSKFAVIVKELE